MVTTASSQPAVGAPQAGIRAPLALAFAAGWLLSNVGAVADPMTRAYGVSLALIGVLAAASIAAHTVMQVPAGHFIDRYGAGPAGICGLAMLFAADAIGAIVPDPVLAFAARSVVGVGTALCFLAGSDLLRSSPASQAGSGRLGLGIVACLWAAAVFVLPGMNTQPTRWSTRIKQTVDSSQPEGSGWVQPMTDANRYQPESVRRGGEPFASVARCQGEPSALLCSAAATNPSTEPPVEWK